MKSERYISHLADNINDLITWLNAEAQQDYKLVTLTWAHNEFYLVVMERL